MRLNMSNTTYDLLKLPYVKLIQIFSKTKFKFEKFILNKL